VSVFEILREQVPLDRLVSANASGKARCVAPDHQDTNPSMHLYDKHVHCYGCGFHGDVVDVWAAMRGFDRPMDAALGLAGEYGIKLPEISSAARKKAEERRNKEEQYLNQTQACHRALEKHTHVREWWEGRGFGPELREQFLLGTNRAGTGAVIPFSGSGGRIQGLIRRKLEGEPRYFLPKAEEFVGGYRPLFIPSSPGGNIFLVEGYIDALAVAAAGRGAIAVGGTGMSLEQEAELKHLLSGDARLCILPDRDEEGAKAARAWAQMFFPKAMICPASYGEGAKDIADTFARSGAEKTGEHLDRLMSGAQDLIDIETAAAAKLEEESVRTRFAYITEQIVPLLARVQPEGLRAATVDIVASQLEGIKPTWINKAIKDEVERLTAEHMAAMVREAEQEQERQRQEHQGRVEEVQDEIDELFAPGVLERLRNIAARIHNVYGDKEPLELALLVALGAQLEPLPNGRPLGASILLTAEAGRGKNHIVDAAVKPLPEDFYFAFEIASGQSLYYMAEQDPGFLKHTFCYPNEIEGAEALWEFLRPMLSKGQARKVVTNKDAAGASVAQEIVVEGPITLAIPTIRNKTDEQLQTRLLVAELPDYPGRVKHHAAAVSRQLLPDAAVADYSRQQFLWQEGLRQLTAVRRVVFPLAHPDFALDDDQVSHGARLWANLLSIMASHAWLEQRNRRLLDVGEGRVAIEATPEDYEAAYRIFTRVCKRTVVNLSDTHRKILGALYDLQNEFPNREEFPQRWIAKGAGVSLSTVSDNKTFLVTSAKLLREGEHGLSLVEGAEPSWWTSGDLMKGLPTPQKVRSWWEGRDLLPEGAERAEHAEHAAEQGQKPHTHAENPVRHSAEQEPNIFGEGSTDEGDTEHVRQAFGSLANSENGTDRRKNEVEEKAFGMFGAFGGSGEDVEPEPDEHPLDCPCIECSAPAPKHASGWRGKL
jgi:DNA primase